MLWALGAFLILVFGLGVALAGSVAGLLLILGSLLVGSTVQQGIQLTLYSAILWAPLGMGMGAAVGGTVVKGYRAKDRSQSPMR